MSVYIVTIVLCKLIILLISSCNTGWLVDIQWKGPTENVMDPCWLFRNYRKDNTHYALFMRRFVKQVVGSHEWDSRILDPTLDPNKLCSVSDEAFAHIVIENNYSRWYNMYMRNDFRIPLPMPQGEDKSKKVLSNTKPKFTTGGNVYDDPPETKTKGWSQAGIDRFNEIFKDIAADRLAHPDWNRKFIRAERKKMEEHLQSKPRAVTKTTSAASYAEMVSFSDDE